MMETFIVLGLCFILYEALDLFHSCYNNNRPQHLIPSSASALVRQQYANNNNNNNNDSCDENEIYAKDTTRLILSRVDEFDDSNSGSEDNYLDSCNKVYSISESIECKAGE